MFVLNHIQISDVIRRFREIDSIDNGGNGDGEVDWIELRRQLEQEQPEATSTELQVRLARYRWWDTNMNGKLDIEEFYRASEDQQPFNSRLSYGIVRDTYEYFRQDDRNGNGVIDPSEVQGSTQEVREWWMNIFDINQDGVIDFGEQLGVSEMADPTLIDHIANVFEHRDASHQFGNHHDGFLRKDALKAAIKDLTPDLTPAQRRDIYRRLVNQYGGTNGAIDLSEFITFMFNELTGNNVA